MIDTTQFEALNKHNKASKLERLVKCQEELGELSAAVLCKEESINKSGSSKPNVLEEGVDTIQCILDLLLAYGHTMADIQVMFDMKNDKWERKMRERGQL